VVQLDRDHDTRSVHSPQPDAARLDENAGTEDASRSGPAAGQSTRPGDRVRPSCNDNDRRHTPKATASLSNEAVQASLFPLLEDIG
jgi:hypothetical protein